MHLILRTLKVQLRKMSDLKLYKTAVFGVLLDTLAHFGDDFTGQMTQPTVSALKDNVIVNVKGQSHQAQLTKR